MSDYKLTLEERETVLRINDVPGSNWDAWTFSERWARKFKKAGYEVKKDHQGGYSCTIPTNRIRILRPEKRKTGFALNRPPGLHSGAISEGQKPS